MAQATDTLLSWGLVLHGAVAGTAQRLRVSAMAVNANRQGRRGSVQGGAVALGPPSVAQRGPGAVGELDFHTTISRSAAVHHTHGLDVC